MKQTDIKSQRPSGPHVILICLSILAVSFHPDFALSQQKQPATKPTSSQKAAALAALTAVDKCELDSTRWPPTKDHSSASAARAAINKVTNLELRTGLETLMSDIQILMAGRGLIGLDPRSIKAWEEYDADMTEYQRDHLELLSKLI